MATPHPPVFGDLLKRYRLAAGLTQERLAQRTHLSTRTISDLERGIQHIPRTDTVRFLAAGLDLSAHERTVFEEVARHVGAGPPCAGAGAEMPPLPPLAATRPAAAPPPDGGPAAPALVGRSHEMARLRRHLAEQGCPLLLLAGEPGIGKTRLLDAVVEQAGQHGPCVVRGGAQRHDGQDPYAPLPGLLKDFMRGRSPMQLRVDLQGCAWLVRLLPELAEGPIPPLPDRRLAPEQERRLMFDAVVRFLGNVAGPQGTLLVVDDLQWAGPGAVHLLDTLVRLAPKVPLRVVGAYRDGEVDPRGRLFDLLADLAHAQLVTQLRVPRLAPAEAACLLDALLQDVDGVDPAVRAQVVALSDGVPFFVAGYAQALHTEGAACDVGNVVPWEVAQGIRQRIAALPDTAREVLRVATVAGRGVSLGDIVGIASYPEAVVLAGLEAACRLHLLEECDDAYHVTHAVVRMVSEADMGVARRTALQRRLAVTLVKDGAAAKWDGAPPFKLPAYDEPDELSAVSHQLSAG